jgi:hypothetical protein
MILTENHHSILGLPLITDSFKFALDLTIVVIKRRHHLLHLCMKCWQLMYFERNQEWIMLQPDSIYLMLAPLIQIIAMSHLFLLFNYRFLLNHLHLFSHHLKMVQDGLLSCIIELLRSVI